MAHKQSLCLLLASGLACTSSDDVNEGSRQTSETTPGDTGVTDTSSETDGGEDFCFPEYPLLGGPFVLEQQEVLTEWVIEPGVHCADAPGLVDDQDPDLLHPDNDIYTVLIYRPSPEHAPGTWPQDRLPVAVFTPGRGLSLYRVGNPGIRYYDSAIEPLVEEGFIVVAIQPTNNAWATPKRFRAQLCSLLWLQSSEPGGWAETQNDRLNCDLVSYGHSRGGEAAILTASLFPDFAAAFPLMAEYDLRGTVALAPRSDLSNDGLVGLLSDDDARLVPFLALQGGNDEDIPGQMLRAFNLWHREELTPITPIPKAALWAYDLAHVAWGGDTDPGGNQKLRADYIMAAYIPAWLKWTVFGESIADNRAHFTSLTAHDVSAADFPPALQDATLWNHVQPQYDQINRPLIFGAYSESGQNDVLARLRVDMLERPGEPASCDDLLGQGAQLSPSTNGLAVEFQGFDAEQVCLSSMSSLSSLNQAQRENTALRIRWGGAEPPGYVRWEVNDDVSSYSAFSVRVGQALDDPNETFLEPLFFRVVLETLAGDAGVEVGPIVQQDLTPKSVASPVGPDTFLQTVRIPLAEFCQSLSFSIVEAVRLEVDSSPNSESQLIFDRLEFTRSDLDESFGCG